MSRVKKLTPAHNHPPVRSSEDTNHKHVLLSQNSTMTNDVSSPGWHLGLHTNLFLHDGLMSQVCPGVPSTRCQSSFDVEPALTFFSQTYGNGLWSFYAVQSILTKAPRFPRCEVELFRCAGAISVGCLSRHTSSVTDMVDSGTRTRFTEFVLISEPRWRLLQT